jgi:hypothetical protein
VLLLLNRNFTSEELQVECVIFNSIDRGIFIGVQGGVTDLIKLLTRQVLAGRPPSPASTDFKLRIPYYCLLEIVPVKQTRKRLHIGVGRPGSLAGRPPPGPTGQWTLHTASSCQVHSRGDTYFGAIPIFLIIS